SLKTSIKTITYLSDIGCLEIQGASLACPQGRLFFCMQEKNHRKKRQQIKKSADRDIISSAHWRDDKRCYVHVYLLRLPQ
ncbi:hypothetical protein AB7W35_25425, partial [Escherichia coli]